MRKLFGSPLFFPLSAIIILIIAFGFYYSRLTEFHFVDEINNVVVGYFMSKGEALYSGVFFNHQMLTVDVSYFIQALLHPGTLYKLIFYHRLFVLMFSFGMDILLICRFRWKALGFVLFFETFKYYLFGNLFLAEALIVQPLVYLLGVILEGTDKKTITFFDLVLGTIFAWFIIFMREPFIPIAIFLLVLLLFFKNTKKQKFFSLIIFSALCLLTLFSVNLSDYFFQVITINRQTVLVSSIKQNQLMGIGSIKAFLYPLTVFFDKTLTFFRVILIYLSANVILIGAYFIYKRKFLLQLGIIFVTLGLANLRFATSDTEFYGAFHMIPWYGLFCFSFYWLLEKIYLLHRKTALTLVGCSIIFFVTLILSSPFYIHQKINTQETFTMDYSHYYSIGQVVKLLSASKDTVFVEGYDTLIYWQADLPSAYKYSLYIPVMETLPIFSKAREDMFNNRPPTFYYTNCDSTGKTNSISGNILKQYSQLFFAGRPVCLYVEKAKLNNISNERIESIRELGYSVQRSD